MVFGGVRPGHVGFISDEVKPEPYSHVRNALLGTQLAPYPRGNGQGGWLHNERTGAHHLETETSTTYGFFSLPVQAV